MEETRKEYKIFIGNSELYNWNKGVRLQGDIENNVNP